MGSGGISWNLLGSRNLVEFHMLVEIIEFWWAQEFRGILVDAWNVVYIYIYFEFWWGPGTKIHELVEFSGIWPAHGRFWWNVVEFWDHGICGILVGPWNLVEFSGI